MKTTYVIVLQTASGRMLLRQLTNIEPGGFIDVASFAVREAFDANAEVVSITVVKGAQP